MRNLSYILSLILFLGAFSSNAQTLEELTKMKTDKETEMAPVKAQCDALQAELDGIQAKIDALPGWTKKLNGTVGFNSSTFNNWVTNPNPESKAASIGVGVNGIANLLGAKHFWRNTANINLGWQKLNIEGAEDVDFDKTVDVFNLNSLFGYNLTSKLAASALGEYRTTLLDNTNNPGYLDLGVGVTYTPMPELIIVAHPLNYNFVFADEGSSFESSLGTKLVADYNKEIYPGVAFRSNWTSFISYKGNEFSNYTWTNGINFTAWKGIGVGLEYAWRKSEQESTDNQTYFLMGLSYAL